jgi:hypothetical protein
MSTDRPLFCDIALAERIETGLQSESGAGRPSR